MLPLCQCVLLLCRACAVLHQFFCCRRFWAHAVSPRCLPGPLCVPGATILGHYHDTAILVRPPSGLATGRALPSLATLFGSRFYPVLPHTGWRYCVASFVC